MEWTADVSSGDGDCTIVADRTSWRAPSAPTRGWKRWGCAKARPRSGMPAR